MSGCTQREIVIAPDATILGVDVGEDFLDLAMLAANSSRLSYHRVPLRGIASPAVDAIAHRIADAIGSDLRGAVALIDSPRTPRDLDCSGSSMLLRGDVPDGRIIDASLRTLLRERFNGAMRPLSMFPTPLASYFAGCIARRDCKPHLRAIAEELLPSILAPRSDLADGKIAGGTFTRFMLAGFAAFPALEKLGVRVFEAYPDLQMRLWSDGVPVPPKRLRGEAIRTRQKICARLAETVGIANFATPQNLDEADAAILGLSAAASASSRSLIELHCPPEGRFAVAFRLRSGRSTLDSRGRASLKDRRPTGSRR